MDSASSTNLLLTQMIVFATPGWKLNQHWNDRSHAQAQACHKAGNFPLDLSSNENLSAGIDTILSSNLGPR